MSNVKRKDSKNRNLRNGESQRKDGRYVYKYTDIYGKPQFIYSWKLVPTDKTPAGKRDDISSVSYTHLKELLYGKSELYFNITIKEIPSYCVLSLRKEIPLSLIHI